MTHRTDTIEVNFREAAAIQNAERWLVVWTLGGGHRRAEKFPASEGWHALEQKVLAKCQEADRGCSIYALGKVDGLETSALCATIRRFAGSWTWKFAEGFDPR